MRHLYAAMLCGVFRVSVYDVKDVCWGTLRKEGAPRLLCFKFNNSCVKSV